MSMLEVRNINVYYGAIHAIKGISFDVEEGEIICLIGANGAGKTTVLNTISGLLSSRTGEISFMGQNLMKIPAHKMVTLGLAHVPEGRHVFSRMTVKENLEMGGYSVPREELNGLMEEVYRHFPRLKERENQIAGTLSGGEQQMLAMGRALMSKPRLLILDEPSMGLSPILVEEIFSIIRSLNEQGTTILLIEQNARMALSVANRGYVLETGKIVLSAPADELLHNDMVQKAYLGG